MDIDFLYLAIGIVAFGYFIGDGLKNFKNPSAKNFMEYLDEGDEHELIKKDNVHFYIGISKEDANVLIEDHPSIPNIVINNTIYFPKDKLRKWLKELAGEPS